LDTEHQKQEFEKQKGVVSKYEKAKKVTGRDEPKHSSLPVVMIQTEKEVINLQNPPEQVVVNV